MTRSLLSHLLAPVLVISVAAFFAGCGGDTGGDAGSGGSGGSGGAGGAAGSGGSAGTGGTAGAGGSGMCQATTPKCEDALFQGLPVKTNAAVGDIVNTDMMTHWESAIDATSGGVNDPYAYSFVYGMFLDNGLIKINIGDESSLTSMDWDIAFRRYVIRLNGGDSGPSCVEAMRMQNGTLFDDVTAVPTTTSFLADDFYTGSDATGDCTLIPDAIGGPNTFLSAWYDYGGCVAMNGNIYIIELRNGRHVKAELIQYYLTGQAGCNTSGTMGSGSANIVMKWVFLD